MREAPKHEIAATPEETWAIAARIAELLEPGSVIALHGELGAGKTCFVQGLGYALGIRRPMTSPTFTITNEYEIPSGKLIHMDLYRLTSPDELLAMGFEEDLREGSIIAIEWPDRAGELLPENTIHVRISLTDSDQARKISIEM